jgi:tetratricopeptide (TPR) repeat protein
MNRWLAILVLFSALMAGAADPANQPATAGVAEFTAAYHAWDGQRFAAAAGLLHQAATNAAASSTNFYWLGTAQFYQLLQLRSAPGSRTNKLAAEAAMDAALESLTTAVKLDERHAECHALLGTLYGMKIDGSLLRGARFGPRVQKHSARALALGADNPRVRYLLGTCQFHTARSAAAQREALASFLAAEKLFRAEAQHAPGPLEPRWGHSTCLTFIGQTYELLGQRAQAAVYFRKALALHPADHVAQKGLARTEDNQ